MTIARDERLPDSQATFGSGGSEPYARALRSGSSPVLYLQKLLHGATHHSDQESSTAEMDFARWNAAADVIDLRLLASVLGPVLDVGCGPGRMVKAALDLGLEVLGIDVSPTAVELAIDNGLPVFEGSVFDRLPREGAWQTVLLVDGNVGIGGNVRALLARCADLLSPTGEIVVELHPDDDRDRTYTGRLVDLHGATSATFPWAEMGLGPITVLAEELGLEVRQAWSADDRSFCRLAYSLT
jgi:SAM-dependent methyltransferase